MKKILGMGNALTDILLRVEDEKILFLLNLPKGSMQLVNYDILPKIKDQIFVENAKMATGGSAANTINGLTKLGIQAGFFGKIGEDKVGSFFFDDLMKNNVIPHLLKSSHSSGTCTVFVTPDGERTMCTYLGAACDFDVDDLDSSLYKGYDIFHIEGYLVQNQELILAAVKEAKDAGLLVSFDLASFNIVEDNIEFLQMFVREYVDIVFANEDEARAFTGKEPEEALELLSEFVDIAVVKLGGDGSFIKSAQKIISVQPYEAVCVDTTGAGDLYAAGFLYGFSLGYSLDVCGKIASLVSARVVEILGAKMPDETWEMILHEINNEIL